MWRHLYLTCKNGDGFKCGLCPQKFPSENEKDQHESSHHQIGGAYFRRLTNAFRCEIYEHAFNQENSVEGAFMNCRVPLLHLLQLYLKRRKLLKYRLVVDGLIQKTDGSQSTVPMRTTTRRLLLGDYRYLEDAIFEDRREILNRQEGILARTGSGESLLGITAVRVELGQCDIFGGSGLMKKADLTKIPGYEYLIDIKKDDELCFYRCVAHALRLALKSNEIPNVTSHLETFMFRELKFEKRAMKLSKIKFFEKANALGQFGVNVFYHEGKMVYPIYRSIFKDHRMKINLLLISDYDQNQVETDSLDSENQSHFVLINDLNQFMSKNISITGTKMRQNVRFCENCLLCFYSQTKLKTHQELCFQNKEQKVRIPKKGSVTEFKNHLKKYPSPFIGFCDFEAILEKRNRASNKSCLSCQEGQSIKNCDHATHVINDHIPVGFSLLFVDNNLNIVYMKQGHGENCMSQFFKALNEAGNSLIPLMNKEAKLKPWNEKWEKHFLEAEFCHICEQPFNDFDFDLQRVRDHDHFSGQPMGVAHNKCNRLRRVPKKLTIYVHNLAGYDSHFLLHNFEKNSSFHKENMRAIPINSQKFRTLEFSKFLFLFIFLFWDTVRYFEVQSIIFYNKIDSYKS